MTAAASGTRQGQRLWLALVSTATIVLVVTTCDQVGHPGTVLQVVAASATVPGVLALGQFLLLRSGHVEPATIGVAGLSAAIIGVNSTTGNGRMVLGVLIALAVALPFALLSGYLVLNAGLGYAMVSAAAVLIGADQLVAEVVSRPVNTYAPALTALGSQDLWFPGVFLFAVGLFAVTAFCGPALEARLRPDDTGWIRPALLVFVPAFLLAVLAGLLYTAHIQAATPGGLGREFLTVCLVALTAGGCSLRTGEADLVDVVVGTAFTGALITCLAVKEVTASRTSLALAATGLVFILLDLARTRRVTEPVGPGPVPAPAPAPD